MRRLAFFVAVVVIVTGCGPDEGTPNAGEPDGASVTGEAGLTALGPLEAEVGSVPRFEWSSIEGAVLYRLVVVGPNGPIWAWEGTKTSVNLGGLTGDRPELMPGPVVEDDTSWSVAAFDTDGNVIDVVGPINLTGDSTSNPEPPASTTTTEAVEELTAADLPDPCTLISQEDVDAIFGKVMEPGESRETTGSGETASGRSCRWGTLSTLSTTIYLSTSYLVPLDVCDWCEPIDGYGDEAWGGITDLGSGGGRLMVVAGDHGIQIEAYGPDVTLEQLGTMAESLLAGLP